VARAKPKRLALGMKYVRSKIKKMVRECLLGKGKEEEKGDRFIFLGRPWSLNSSF
jgi:hypothetical protein